MRDIAFAAIIVFDNIGGILYNKINCIKI